MQYTFPLETSQQLSHVCNVFLQIGLSIVPLLTDQELIDLGVKTVGDRALLRKHCRESIQSE